MAKAFKNKNKYIYIYGSKLAQSFSSNDKTTKSRHSLYDAPLIILGDPGAVSRVDKMFVVKVYCKIETSPWALRDAPLEMWRGG